MCLDRPDHYARGKGPLRPHTADLAVETEELELLITAPSWFAVFRWMEESGAHEFDSHDTRTDEHKAAAARCVVTDYSNTYEHAWHGTELRIYGEPDW